MGYEERILKAPTLDDLRDVIDYIITVQGEDATWNAHDGEINIWNDAGELTGIVVEP